MTPGAATCPRCAAPFFCGRLEPTPCACSSVALPATVQATWRAQYSGCLCPDCLQVAAGAAPPRRLRCEQLAGHAEFRALADLPAVAVDLRYAGPHNFVGRDLYAGLSCAWLHRHAADGLAQAAAHLAATAPGLRLCVLDALRPHRVQVQLWAHLAGSGLRQYVADPVLGSIHSFGMAVDVTLQDTAGQALDMGSGFDQMDALSHPALEADHLRSGRLAPAQVAHRRLLRQAMAAGGFHGIDNEWWHFECGDRPQVRQRQIRVD